MSLRGWTGFTALALLAHAVLFAAMMRVRHEGDALVPPVARASSEPQEISVVLLSEAATPGGTGLEPPQARRSAPGRRETREAAAALPAGALATREPGGVVQDEAPLAPEPGAPASTPSAAPGEQGWTFSPTRSVDVAAPAFIARSVRDIAREGTPPPSPPLGPLDMPTDRDVALGLGRGGPVLSAVEAASRTMDVPIEGAATFDVTIDTAGHVSVALADASSAYDAWSKVGAAAGAAVDVKKVRMPPGARGLRVVVRVESRVQYPDGSRPKDMGTRFEATPGEISKDSMVMKKLPGVTLSTRGKVCGVGISVVANPLMPVVIGGGCDPENAGVAALRVVSGHIVAEGRL